MTDVQAAAVVQVQPDPALMMAISVLLAVVMKPGTGVTIFMHAQQPQFPVALKIVMDLIALVMASGPPIMAEVFFITSSITLLIRRTIL